MVQRLLVVVVAFVAALAAVALVEGLASLAISAGLFFGSSGHVALDRFARYDPALGWASVPNVALPDLYGPGVGFHTNTHGFRGRVDPAPAPPPGKTRVVCSGDSFTLGPGVADDATWCALLASLDPRLETVNMGQGGYGVDQAFLWYRRDGAALAPAVHLFAFIDADFERMRSTRFLGDYGKPTLAVRDGALVVEHVPAWRRPFWMPTVRVREIVKRTKTYELVDRIGRRLSPQTAPPAVDPAERDRVVDAALAVFAELRATAEKRGGTLVLVYLPTAFDCRLPVAAPSGLAWWPTIGPRAAAAGFRIVDLSPTCRRLPAAEQDALFFPEGVVRFYAAAGHYTAAGNRFVAEALRRELAPVLDAAAR
ncbi:MAG: hypothetical protein IT293_00215 [Deltaproteobacteria bacterium]|nr:hypothetical protein [Deltaproteobacteria bacterium]